VNISTIIKSLSIVALVVLCWSSIASAVDSSQGKRLYGQYCIPCHGLSGQGDGDRVKKEQLDPMPRIHANGNYMNQLPDMRLFRVIKFGGRSMNFSKIMPQWQHILADNDIINIIAHIRTLADPPFQPGMAVMGGCRLPPPENERSGS
jgi:cytochrome c